MSCLAVNGNTATLVVEDTLQALDHVGIQVVDNAATGTPDTFDSVPFRQPVDCSPIAPTGLLTPIASGDIIVIDAPPLPTSKDQCKNNGWRNYASFKNQGQCVSFVATGGKKQP